VEDESRALNAHDLLLNRVCVEFIKFIFFLNYIVVLMQILIVSL
jgi:hypothetical protein